MTRSGSILVAALLGLALAAGLAVRDLWQPRIHGDGVGYYAPLASLVVDGDLDLRNELAHLNRRYLQAAFMTPDGHLGNPFPVGPALLWAPAVLAVRALPPGGWLDTPLPERIRTPHPAFAPRFARAVWLANLLLVGLAACALLLFLRSRTGDLPALLATLGGLFATPVFWYAGVDPAYGHAASFAAVTAFVVAVCRDRHRPLPLELLGFLWGCVALVRSQDAVLGVLLVPPLLERWRRDPPATTRQRLRLTLSLAWRTALPALVAFAPQMLFWWRIYGTPLLVPPGPDLLPWWRPQLFHLLFSTWNGVVPWTPWLNAGIAGWMTVPDRRLRAAAGVALALELWTSAMLQDWWGGAAFGPRRLVSIVPLAVVGWAFAIHHVAQRFDTTTRRRLALVLAAGITLLLGAVEVRLAQYKRFDLLPANPGNAGSYVRHYPPGSPRTRPYGHWDYVRLVAEAREAERQLRAIHRARQRRAAPR